MHNPQQPVRPRWAYLIVPRPMVLRHSQGVRDRTGDSWRVGSSPRRVSSHVALLVNPRRWLLAHGSLGRLAALALHHIFIFRSEYTCAVQVRPAAKSI